VESRRAKVVARREDDLILLGTIARRQRGDDRKTGAASGKVPVVDHSIGRRHSAPPDEHH
jgi:hypothetical protein